MTKKDMIIIAALVNAGLLAMLFMMAINSDEDNTSTTPETTNQLIVDAQPTDPLIPSPDTVVQPADEGDNALKEFQTTPAPLPVIADETQQTQDPLNEAAQTETASTEPQQPAQAAPKEEITIAEAPAEPAEPKSKTVEVTVKRGDSLDKIARANGTTIKAIKKENNLKTDKLDIGQVLRVPTGTKKAQSIASKKEAANKSKSKEVAENTSKLNGNGQQFYTIKDGDNPWKIAKKHHIKVSELLKLNNMDEDKARNLKPGDRIRVK